MVRVPASAEPRTSNLIREPARSDRIHEGVSEVSVEQLYEQLLNAWNERSAAAVAAQFTDDGNLVGFDGSQVDSRAAIAEHLRPIFTDHPTAAYVAKVREVRMLSDTVAILRAVAGMVPPGSQDLKPELHTVHTLVAVRSATHEWRAALFQSTPAAWHGRPDDRAALTDELREVYRRRLL
jgi:uncharacterized protein (TIGR02246 family)